MFDCLKRKVNAKIIIQFMKNAKKPKYLEILKYRKEIEKYVDLIDLDFIDLSINEYKIYECKTYYEDKIENNSVSIYYNRTNYIQCGDGKHSVEIIFSDFLSKDIRAEECSIVYDGIKYIPMEDFGLSTRKRINFLNVDINKFEFPKDMDNNIIKINTIDNKNFLVSISLIDKPKIIAIYSNNPFIEKKLNYTEKEIDGFLDSSLKSINKYVYVKDEEIFDEYFKRYKDNKEVIVKNYMREIKNSYEIEKKISEYFVVPREQLNTEQIKIYEKYAEFMIYFPKLFQDSPLEKDIMRICRLYRQYYYSYNSFKNFYKTLQGEISESEKVKLLYSVARCLRTLLNRGYGSNNTDLFEFIDFTKKETVYHDAINYNKKFIDSLTEKSEIFLFFMQINSGSSINLLNNEFMSRISMLDAKSIKGHLYETIPKYGIRLLCNPTFYGCTFNEVKTTCINEMGLLGESLNNKTLLSKADHLYNRRFLLANLMQHEDFGHIKFSINFYSFFDEYTPRTNETHHSENLSPFKYLMIKDKKEYIQEIVKEEKNNERKINKQNTKKPQQKNEEIEGIFESLNVTIKNNLNEKKKDLELKEKNGVREDIKKEPQDNIKKDKDKDQNKKNRSKKDLKYVKDTIKEKDFKEKYEVREIAKKEPQDKIKKDEDKEKKTEKKSKENLQPSKGTIKETNPKEKSIEKKGIKNSPKATIEDMKKGPKIIIQNKIKEKNDKLSKNINEEKVPKMTVRNQNKEKEEKDETNIKRESGIALSFFLTRGKYQLMKLLSKKGIDFEKLFKHPELQAGEDLTKFIDNLTETYKLNPKAFEGDNDNDIECRTKFKKSKLYSNYKPYGIPTIEKFA